jgi:cytochrome P450
MTDTAVGYNPCEPGFAENPYAQYRAMREVDPVYRSAMGFWIMFGCDQVQSFLRDPSLSADEHNLLNNPFGLGREVAAEENGQMLSDEELLDQVMLGTSPGTRPPSI